MVAGVMVLGVGQLRVEIVVFTEESSEEDFTGVELLV